MASRIEIEVEATKIAKLHIEDFVDPVTNEVQLTELGEWLAAEFKFEDGDETPFEIAFTVAEWRDRMLKNPASAPAMAAKYGYR